MVCPSWVQGGSPVGSGAEPQPGSGAGAPAGCGAEPREENFDFLGYFDHFFVGKQSGFRSEGGVGINQRVT